MLEIKNLNKTYLPKRGTPVHAISNVSVNFEDKGMVFILGKSGSGKSTFLNLVGGLDSMDGGEVIIKGKSSKDFSQSDFDSYRNTFIGFIFQEYNILNEFSVGHNIALALELQGKKAGAKEVDAILEQVDLVGYANRKPSELSGGQKQRVAIARALIKDPQIIMADEPTGALDSNTGKQVFETLQKLSKDKLVIIVSHDREYAEYYGDRVIEFADGKIISDIKKYKSEGENLSKNVKIIDNKILHVLPNTVLTQKEKDSVIDFLSGTDSELIISKDARSNKEFRRVSRIDEAGNKESFEEVKNEKLKLKQYNAADFKLIRSRLPYRHSLKIGASSLKAKPFRLVITILLASIAFALFGLVDTLGAYNKVDVTYNSMIDAGVNYASFVKSEVVKYKNGSDEYSYVEDANMDNADFDSLKTKFSDYKFDKIYDFSSGYGSGGDFLDNLYDAHGISFAPGPYYTHALWSGSIRFNGLIEIEENGFSSRGYSLVGKYPANFDEIVISKHYFNFFKDFSYTDVNNLDSGGKFIKTAIANENNLIDKKITVNGKEFKIVGIVDTKFPEERYSQYKSTLGSNNFYDYYVQMELENMAKYSYHTMAFMKTGFYENLKAQQMGNLFTDISSAEKGSFYIRTNNNFGTSLSYGAVLAPVFNDCVRFADNSKTTLSDNELIIDIDSFSNLTGIYLQDYSQIETKAKAYIQAAMDNPVKGPLINAGLISKGYPSPNASAYYYYLQNNDGFASDSFASYNNKAMLDVYTGMFFSQGEKYFDVYAYSREGEVRFKVVGIAVNSINSKNYNWFFISNQGTFDYIAPSGGEIVAAVTMLKNSRGKDIELIKFSYETNGDVRYGLKNAVSYMIDLTNDMVEQLAQIFLYVGIGIAVFAALMLMNFITISISYKKREIGILRAIGARSSDVFGIFFNEALIIALISFLLAAIGAGFAAVFINSILMTDLGLLISILTFSIRQILLILGVSVLTAFISSFLPVYKVARKKPVEAIRNA